MSLFSDIADGIGSFFGGVSNAVGGAGNLVKLGGTALSMIGNDNAAHTIAQGNQTALNDIQNYDAQARGDVLNARDQATGALQPYVAAGQPARQYLQRTMTTDPSKLTPMQQIGLQDLQREEMNNLSVAGMRGAGYGGQAVLGDATQRYLGNAFNTNQARSDQAAGTLNNQGYGATQGTANVNLGTGSNLASIGIGEGQAAGSLARSTADTNAGAGLANSRALSNGLGSLSAGSTSTPPTTTTPTTTSDSTLVPGGAASPSPSSGGLSSIGQYMDDQQRTQDPYANFTPMSGG